MEQTLNLPSTAKAGVPSWEAIFENKLGIMSILIVSDEYP